MQDTALRILPLTDVDAHEMICALCGSPLLFGYCNTPTMAVDALEDLLLRIGGLADAIPEIAELDCNPVIVSSTGATAVDVKVRLAPPDPAPPPGVRRLRSRPDDPPLRGTGQRRAITRVSVRRIVNELRSDGER